MKKLILGFSFLVLGIALGIFASQRNCLVALITQGKITFWTGIEILAGIIIVIGLIIFLRSLSKKIMK